MLLNDTAAAAAASQSLMTLWSVLVLWIVLFLLALVFHGFSFMLVGVVSICGYFGTGWDRVLVGRCVVILGDDDAERWWL